MQARRFLGFALVAIVAALSFAASAQSLSPAQKVTLKAHVLANQDTATLYTDGNLTGLADALNATASPSFWVWRTNVTRSELYHGTSPDGTTWNWTTYKAQSQTEQGAWVQMFMGDQANCALPNLRAGIAAIFTGSAQQNAQRDHCLATCRRLASRIEKLLATGTGSSVSPATMTFEGTLFYGELIGL